MRIETDTNVFDFVDTMHFFGYVHTIPKSTRVTNSSFSIRDDVFTSNYLQYMSVILTFDVPDHFPVILNQFFTIPNTSEIIKVRIINDVTL